MSVAIRKLDGVESIDVSLEKATADIKLKAGNTVNVPQLRRIIRQSGYPTKDAQIEARGAIVDRGGRPALDLQNGTFLELAARPPGATSAVIDVKGVSRVMEKDREVLTIR